MQNANHPVTTRAREEGSAYIITLMVMFTLTVIGLGLSLVTQTEMLVGSQERTIQRNFYAADSGLNTALMAMLSEGDYRSKTFRFVDTIQPYGTSTNMMDMNDVVVTTPFIPIHDYTCNLCPINQGSEFYSINHAVSVRATRTGSDVGAGGGAADVPLARKDLTVMLEIQPRKQVTSQGDFTPAQASQIKF